jgi:dephospho-CoA kinase
VWGFASGLGRPAPPPAPMSEAELQARHERFLIEQQAKPIADVVIDNSGDIELAYAEFDLVIEAAYNKCK